MPSPHSPRPSTAWSAWTSSERSASPTGRSGPFASAACWRSRRRGCSPSAVHPLVATAAVGWVALPRLDVGREPRRGRCVARLRPHAVRAGRVLDATQRARATDAVRRAHLDVRTDRCHPATYGSTGSLRSDARRRRCRHASSPGLTTRGPEATVSTRGDTISSAASSSSSGEPGCRARRRRSSIRPRADLAHVDFCGRGRRGGLGRRGHASDAERARDAQRRNELQDVGFASTSTRGTT